MEVIVVNERLASKRLDVALAEHPKIASRSEAKRMIVNALVRVGDSAEPPKPNKILKVGERIAFTSVPAADPGPVAVPFDLEILYEDDCLLVVDKPRGTVVHPGAGHQSDTLVNYLLHHTRLSALDATRPGIVHRIDKDTSGLLVVAKDNRTHEGLARQFAARSTERTYQAIVWGIPATGNGVIDKALGRDPVHRRKFAVRENGKSAVTHWRIVERYRHLSLLECRLETGRTHQIRVHLGSVGHPVLGDRVYGRLRKYVRSYPESVRRILHGFSGQALHAKTLGFLHPHTKKKVRFDSPLPEDMQAAVAVLQTDGRSRD